MQEHLDITGATIANVEATELDWKALANRRLQKLVEAEHDCSVLRDRMSGLQSDLRESLLANDRYLRRIHELETQGFRKWGRKNAAASEYRYEFRNASWTDSGKWLIKRVIRALMQVRLLRTMIRRVARLVPGLSARVLAAINEPV